MQCSCGGHTTDRQVVMDKVIEGRYDCCTSCGRIHWSMKSDKLKQKLLGGKNER